IGLAFRNHDDTVGGIPTAGSDGGAGHNPSVYRADFGWTYEILPFIEQGALHDLPGDSTYTPASGGNPASQAAGPHAPLMRKTVISIYYCPLRRGAKLYGGWAKTDYAGNGGTRVWSFPFDGPVIRSSGSNNYVHGGPLPTRMIKDGLSNTMFVGEKAYNGSP